MGVGRRKGATRVNQKAAGGKRTAVGIPSHFQLMGHDIDVHVVPIKDWTMADCAGYWEPGENRIVLAEQAPDVTFHTFCHELVHAILSMMSHPLNEDEVFVDQLGGLLAQALKSSI